MKITHENLILWQRTLRKKVINWATDLNTSSPLYEAAAHYCLEQNPHTNDNWVEYFTNVYRILSCMHHNDPIATRLMLDVISGIRVFYGEIFYNQACNPRLLERFEDHARLLAMRRMFATA